jgi:hypothetical protein
LALIFQSQLRRAVETIFSEWEILGTSGNRFLAPGSGFELQDHVSSLYRRTRCAKTSRGAQDAIRKPLSRLTNAEENLSQEQIHASARCAAQVARRNRDLYGPNADVCSGPCGTKCEGVL